MPAGKIERIRQANVFWNGRIDEIVQVLEANLGQHGVDFLVVRPDVAADETAQFLGRFRRGGKEDFSVWEKAVFSGAGVSTESIANPTGERGRFKADGAKEEQDLTDRRKS